MDVEGNVVNAVCPTMATCVRLANVTYDTIGQKCNAGKVATAWRIQTRIEDRRKRG